MMNSKLQKFARFGMCAKGSVYALIGILTALAAFGFGGQEQGTTGSLDFLATQSYGKIALSMLCVGLLGYVFWRLYQAFGSHNQVEANAKGLVKRIAYFISAGAYAYLAFHAGALVVDGVSSSSLSNSGADINTTLVVMVTIGIAIKAVFDLYRAYSGKFREQVKELHMSKKEQKLLLNAGKFGHGSRGVILGFMVYLTVNSLINNTGVIAKKMEAFSYIKSTYGSVVLGVIALGLIAYGIFMFIKAKYPDVGFSE